MKGIMIQGTASDVGKSYITTAICRMLSNMGYNVAPFKSQNISNNSYVTIDSLEMGRAQGAQAEAARVIPRTYMNPILLKPSTNQLEVVLNGTVFQKIDGYDYSKEFAMETGLQAIHKALKEHKENHDIIVIEGAGSPAEVNLNKTEIVNMRVANAADVDVILVADIDRGGSFASIVGTLELLFEDRHRVKGIIINKFRGDLSKFEEGINWIEEYTNIKVLGVLPYIEDIYIETEDAQSEILFHQVEGNIDIGVIKLDRISNHTDIEPFRFEPDVNIRMIHNTEEFGNPDAVIIPGTKASIDDLLRLKEKGLDKQIKNFIQEGGHVIGVCGGFQMLGSKLIDPNHIDSTIHEVEGLRVFDIETTFKKDKSVRHVKGTLKNERIDVLGYEIHLGDATYNNQDYFIRLDNGTKDGAVLNDHQVIGTYLHNIFHNDSFRTYWLNKIRTKKARPTKDIIDTTSKKEDSFERLAKVFQENIDIEFFMKLIYEQ